MYLLIYCQILEYMRVLNIVMVQELIFQVSHVAHGPIILKIMFNFYVLVYKH